MAHRFVVSSSLFGLLALAGCGSNANTVGFADSDSGGAGDVVGGSSSGAVTGGQSSGGDPSFGGDGGAAANASGTTGGSAGQVAGSPSTGGEPAAGGASTGGEPAAGGASTGGEPAAGGAFAGGSDTGGSATAGVSTGGSSAGGADGCIDVCELYGPPCCIGSGDCIEPGGSCVLEVLSATVDVPNDYAELEQEIATLPQDVLVSIADTDFAWVAAAPAPAAYMLLQMTPQASALHGAALEEVAAQWRHNPFRLSCNGQRLFVGINYPSIGAQWIEVPVLGVGRNEEDVVALGLGAWQGAWGVTDLGDPAAREAAERIDRPEFREVFCQRGALRELDPGTPPPDS